jgi:hypothetical protein
MMTSVRLPGGGKLPIRIFPRDTANPRVGWLYVVCVEGGAGLLSDDGSPDQPPAGEVVMSPGVLVVSLRANADRAISYTIVAQPSGCRLEIHLELGAEFGSQKGPDRVPVVQPGSQ